ALVLATNKPKSFLDGTTVDTYRALSVVNKLEYHHIFPKAYLNSVGVSRSEANYHLNISMQNLSNNREISDSKPSDYFKLIEDKVTDKLAIILESNFISNDGFEAGKMNDYNFFLQERNR